METTDRVGQEVANGAAVAAVLAGGIGAFAMGFFVILNEIGLLTAPTLYQPAGGVTGRTALAVVAWLVTWAVLHGRWRAREIDPGRAYTAALVLTVVGIVLCLPPVWGLVA